MELKTYERLGNLRQGKCSSCRVRYKWPVGWLRLRDAYCPGCQDRLKQTTHLLDWPVVYKWPLHISDLTPVSL